MPPPGTLIAGRYRVQDYLGTAVFSTAVECIDVEATAAAAAAANKSGPSSSAAAAAATVEVSKGLQQVFKNDL